MGTNNSPKKTEQTFERQNYVERDGGCKRKSPWLDASLTCLALAVFTFLTIKSAVHVASFALLLIAIAYLISKSITLSKHDYWVLILLAAPTAAIAISQAMNSAYAAPPYDAPSRLLLAAPIYLMIKNELTTLGFYGDKILRTITTVSALTLLVLPLFFDDQRSSMYGGRFSTAHADTNSLGSHVSILLMLSWIGLIKQLRNYGRSTTTTVRTLKAAYFLTAIVVGTIVIIETQSRGAWIAYIVSGSLAVFYLIRLKLISLKKLMLSLLTSLMIITPLINTQQFNSRFNSIAAELTGWFKDDGGEGSGTIRLNMLLLTMDLLAREPIKGYGTLGYAEQLQASDIRSKYSESTIFFLQHTGPHNGIAAKALESGLLGFLAISALLLAPIIIARRHLLTRARLEHEPTLLALAGLSYFVCLLMLQFTLEPLTLKYIAAFDALMIATFLAIFSTVDSKDNK